MINRRTIEVLDSRKCTGCASCYNACPIKAIEMNYDENGFLYPNVEIGRAHV